MNEQKIVDLLEGIKREMELQNDLKMNDMLHNEPTCSRYEIEEHINNMTRGKLYARLSDEDRSIMERYRKPNGSYSKELSLYNMTVRGFSLGCSKERIQRTIEDMHDEILEDVYTEKELYEYFERVFERTNFVLEPLDYYWEKVWQSHKEKKIDNYDGTVIQWYIYYGYNEETWEKRKQEVMKKYENRITKPSHNDEEVTEGKREFMEKHENRGTKLLHNDEEVTEGKREFMEKHENRGTKG